MTKGILFTLLFLSAIPLYASTESSTPRDTVSHCTNIPVNSSHRAIELSASCKVYYPDRMGLSPNESLLSLFRTIPGLMSTDEIGLSDKISLAVDNESHIFDVNSVLRRIRVMDVSRIEIVNTSDANSGTSGLSVSVHVFLKRVNEGFHGNAAIDVNTNGTVDPTMNFGWRKGRWSVLGSASLYFDRSNTTTTTLQRDRKSDILNESFTDEEKRSDSYGESASLKVRYDLTANDKISVSISQEHLKVKTWSTTSTQDENGITISDTYTRNKQNSNSFKLGYRHRFKKCGDFNISSSAKFQDNPLLYNYQYFGINNKNTENTNTGSNTKRLYLDVSQNIPLWNGFELDLGEKYVNGRISDLTKIKIGDQNTFYDIHSTNSQTYAQLNCHKREWSVQIGEVLDYFHYGINITGLPDKSNSTTTPQTYVSVGYRFNDTHSVHTSYRTGLTRPNYKQIYPISTTISEDKYYTQDSLFRSLNNSKVHTFNLGYSYDHDCISISTNIKTILINNMLTRIGEVWKNSDRNNIYRLYSSLVWSPTNFTTAISGSANLLSYKYTEKSDYEKKYSFNLRWMGVYNMKRGWSVGSNIQYNGPVWFNYGQIESYVWAEAHVTKTIGKWSFNANMSDIFDMKVNTIKETESSYKKTTEEKNYQGLSLGISYKF